LIKVIAVEPPAGYKRLSPEKPEIRLRNTYVLAVTEYITDINGDVGGLRQAIQSNHVRQQP
jgi:glutaminyl-tRNA synthetase